MLSLLYLLTTLEALPKTPAQPYWTCPEGAYAHLVLATDDAKAWEALEKVAKRSDVGLRMEFMNPMNYSNVGEQQRKQRLKFLAAFFLAGPSATGSAFGKWMVLLLPTTTELANARQLAF